MNNLIVKLARVVVLILAFYFIPFLTMGLLVSFGALNPAMSILTSVPLIIYIWFAVDTVKLFQTTKRALNETP